MVFIKNKLELESIKQNILKLMQLVFGNNPFYKFHAQKFNQFPTLSSYWKEKDKLIKTFEKVYIKNFSCQCLGDWNPCAL